MTGAGELRHTGGAGETASYSGHLLLGGRTIMLQAAVARDSRGRFFRLSATLDPNSYTETELDAVLAKDSTGSGLGVPRPARSGPLVDDPIPFGAA